MTAIVASAPGKIHLIGEHAVVYGAPAILAAIDKRVKITLKTRNDDAISISLKNAREETSCKKILSKTQHARQQWEFYQKTLNKQILADIIPDAVTFVEMAIGESLIQYRHSGNPELVEGVSRISSGGDAGQASMTGGLSGFDLEIFSQIPLGSGLGSSAAIAVSVAAAIGELLDRPFDKEKINDIAFQVEKLKHGFPSGGDNSICSYGGFVIFQKKDERFMIDHLPFTISDSLTQNFVLINTGVPKESTGEMVHGVRQLFTENEHLKTEFLESQTALTHECITALQTADGTSIIRIIRATEKNLESIGVVSTMTKNLIRTIERSGGAGKICGAGGKAQFSGMILAFHKNPNAIYDIADDFGMEASEVVLGGEGVRIE